jgi:hypothetical protein
MVTALPQNLGNHPTPHQVPYVLLVLPGLLAIWFSPGSLVTEIRETEVSIHFHLLWAERVISWGEIRSAEAVTYSSGGWSVRWGAGEMNYNVSGNRGVRIELGGGESVMVGPPRADEISGRNHSGSGCPNCGTRTRFTPEILVRGLPTLNITLCCNPAISASWKGAQPPMQTESWRHLSRFPRSPSREA